MAIEEVKDVFPITAKESGYRLNGRLWTRSSDVLYWHKGVVYCHDKGLKLQTLDDAIEFRYESNGQDNSNSLQLTGTLVALGNDGMAGLRAYVWEPSAEELFALANHDTMSKCCYVYVAKNNTIGRKVLKTDRTFIVPQSDPNLSVEADKRGNSPYNKDEGVLALMPKSAKLNAENIARAGYDFGSVLYDRPLLHDGQLLIRPACLGGYDKNCIKFVINVDNVYFYIGRARGSIDDPAQKSSSRNKSCRVAKSKK